MILTSRARTLSLDTPRVMGILNVTPDSFSDGGRFVVDGGIEPRLAVAAALEMVEQGGDLIDIGGESTRPDARPVSTEEELRRTIPVIEALRPRTQAWISIDTSNPVVMQAAVDAGADLINDVRALRRPGALECAARSGVAICLMHMQGEPATMQRDPHYDDPIAEIAAFLAERRAAAESAGIAMTRILLDPGFGFGKTLEHNLALLRGLDRLAPPDIPLLVGLSRKRMVAELTGRSPGQRTAGSVALALEAVQRGARVLRVHDVAETVDALRVYSALH